MGEVVQFPSQPRVQLFLAEEYARDQIRQELGACMGILHGHTTSDDLRRVVVHLHQVVALIDAITGIREACK